jgi:hypothetical protein
MKTLYIGVVMGVSLYLFSGTADLYGMSCREFAPVVGQVQAMRDGGISKNTAVKFLRAYSSVSKAGPEWTRKFLKMTDFIYGRPPVYVHQWVKNVSSWCLKTIGPSEYLSSHRPLESGHDRQDSPMTSP